MIDIYNSFNKNYEYNGDITLEPISCDYHVEMNNIYEIEFVHPYDKFERWKYIKDGAVLKGPLPNGKYGLFKILKPNKGLNNITATGVPIAIWELSKKVLPSTVKIVEKSGQEALDIILKDTGYIGHSNIITMQNCTFFKNNVLQAINGEQDNTFIKRWKGEFLPINKDIYIEDKLGGDYGSRIEYGFNLKDINLERDMTNIVTRIYPYITVETTDTIELPEKYIDSPLINKYPDVYEQYIDFSEYMHLKDGEDDIENAYKTKEELYIAMRHKCMELFKNGLDKPKVTGKVEKVALENTIEYFKFKDSVKTDLGDVVHIKHTDIQIETKERVVGFVWDMVNEKYKEISIGELEENAFDMQTDAVNNLDNILNDDRTVNSAKLQGTINALKTKFNALRDIAQPQHVRAMIFEDKIKGSATYGAMCLGSMGFEIASKRTLDDKDWDWRTFGTGQGFFADWLVGKLKTVLIENMDGSFSIDLNKPGGALFKNNGKYAIEIRNNAVNLYNWAKDGDFIGALTALIQGKDKDRPLIGITNEKTSAVSIGYKDPKSSTIYPSYMEFDKYNILGNNIPICFKENANFENNSLFFGENKECEIYCSEGKDLIANCKHSFGVRDKDSKNLIAYLGSDYTAFGKWNDSDFYAYFQRDNWTLPGLFKNKGDKAIVAEKFHSNGDITCSGKKNRVVETEHYGKLLQNAYETCECYFGDIQETVIPPSGEMIIQMDKKFLETVNTKIPYQVFTTKYGPGDLYPIKRNEDSFVMKGPPGTKFCYEVKAKQKDYENDRLEGFKEPSFIMDKKEG